jgi:hypothetical protein
MISGRNYSRTSWKRLIPKADTTEGEKKQETATAQKIMHVYFSLSTHGVTLGSSRAPSQGQSAETQTFLFVKSYLPLTDSSLQKMGFSGLNNLRDTSFGDRPRPR